MRGRRLIGRVALVALVAGVLAGCGGSGSGGGGQTATGGGSALDKLVAAAKKEGELTVYGAPQQEDAERVIDAFSQQYGIQVRYQRLVSAELEQRYAAEMSAGAPSADLILSAVDPFFADAEKKGWIVGTGKANIPDFPPPGFSKRFLVGDLDTALAQIVPHTIAFNTDKVPAAQAPKDWPALLNPRFKGQVLMVDPTSSSEYVDFWYLVERKYGLGYLQKLRAQVSRMYPSTVPMTQALGAGEGAVGVPALRVTVAPAKAQGAPVADTMPPVTSGPAIPVGISVKAKHPNAARLFARFLLSRQGQGLLNQADGAVAAYNEHELPSGFARVDHAKAMAHQREIFAALGVK